MLLFPMLVVPCCPYAGAPDRGPGGGQGRGQEGPSTAGLAARAGYRWDPVLNLTWTLHPPSSSSSSSSPLLPVSSPPEPTVFDEAELSLYEELWENARTLTESEAKPLAKSVPRASHGSITCIDLTFHMEPGHNWNKA